MYFVLVCAISALPLSLATASCYSKTGPDVIAELRAEAGCTAEQIAAATSCACKPTGHGAPPVDCNSVRADNTSRADDKALWASTWTGAASECVDVTPDWDDTGQQHVAFSYPSNYGNTCAQSGKEPGSYSCTVVAGQEANHSYDATNTAAYNSDWNSADWCTKQFCWVDVCTCNAVDIQKSSWFGDVQSITYSYSACGAADIYTAEACSDRLTQERCDEIYACHWGELPDTDGGGADADGAASGAEKAGTLGAFVALILVSLHA